jgi:GNAT superfamily N-acetyltransferase
MVSRFRSEHCVAVRALILPIQREEFGVPITLDDQPDLIDIAAHYGRGDGAFWVEEEAGEVLGTIGLLDIGHRHLALRKMFVRCDARGPERGVAARLLAAAIAHASARDVEAIYLGTTAGMARAHRFYEKNAFVEVVRGDLPAHFPIMGVDTKFYRLGLS